MGQMKYRALASFIAAATAILAWWLLGSGFKNLQELRQLERVPESKAGTVLAGEVNLNARAYPVGQTLSSPYTSTSSLYFLYLHEVERRDSDGDTYWDTVSRVERAVDFWLGDETGRIKVLSNSSLSQIKWSVAKSFQTVVGDNRYTEWRIEPSDSVYVFAKAKDVRGDLSLTFYEPGFYTPIISNFSQGKAQASMGFSTLVFLWFGLACVALCVFSIIVVFNRHRLLFFLSVLSLVLLLVLVQFSFEMMREDIQNGITRYENQIKAVENQTQNILNKKNESLAHTSPIEKFVNEGVAITPSDIDKIKEYRLTLASGYQMLKIQMEASPERWLLPLWGIKIPERPTVVDASLWPEANERTAAFPDTQISPFTSVSAIVIGGVLFFVATFLGYRQVRFKRLIENIPSIKSKGISVGLSETVGTVTPFEEGKALVSPVTQSTCYWYYYKEEHKEGSGKDAKWVTVEKRTRFGYFYCEDDEGRILVNPKGAEVISKHKVVECHGDRRYTENTLRENDSLYAIGTADINKNASDTLILVDGEDSEPFILSNYTEREVMLKKAQIGMALFCGAFSSMLIAVLMFLGGKGGFAATDFLAASMAAPGYLILVMLVLHYNDLIYLRKRAERNAANVQVSLKKRANLLKSLVKIAKQYFQHEKALQVSLAQSRKAYAEINESSEISAYLSQERHLRETFSALVEDYPDLKANQLISDVSESMVVLENEISLLRKGYNNAVELYNTRISTVPDVAFASMFGFRPKSYIT